MSRTLKQQLGFEADPHAPEHFDGGSGQRLTKVYTRGGHAVESGQKGLPTYHRRIGNPFPVFAIGIGASLLILGLVFVQARGLQEPHISLNVALPLGGFGVMTAAMFAFAEGNTFLATAAGSLAGIVGSLSLVYIPWTGIQLAYVEAAEGDLLLARVMLYKATGIIFFGAMIPIFFLFLASFKTAVPVSSAALIITVALIVQGVAFIHYPMVDATKACGALFIMVGVTLWYSALSVLLAEEGIKILPVLPLPRME